MEATSEIGKHGGGFVVGMGGSVEDASGDTGVFDGFHGFRKSRTGTGGRRELGLGAGGKDQEQQYVGDRKTHSQKWLCHCWGAVHGGDGLSRIENFHWAASEGGAANRHSFRRLYCPSTTTR